LVAWFEIPLAVAKRIKPQDGSPDADFFRVNAWAQQADYITQYGRKGRLVAVEGRLTSRKYTTSDGQSREVVEVVADSLHLLDRPRDDQADPPSQAHKADPPAADEYDPFI
jgi:single-strand DNA-binding protein